MPDHERRDPDPPESSRTDDERLDEAGRESFPASDPPATSPVGGVGAPAEPMIPTILVATDGSERSLLAVRHARRTAVALGGHVTVLHVLVPESELPDDDTAASPDAVASRARMWERELHSKFDTSDGDLAVHVAIAQADETPAEMILRAAGERRARLVVMGTHGAGVIRRAAVGSVATSVLGDAWLPVMVVGEQVGAPAETGPYRIVAATDGSSAAEAMVASIGELLADAPPDRVGVTLLRVYEEAHGDPPRADALADCRQSLSRLRGLLPETLPVALEVLEAPAVGGPRGVILAFAKEHAADVLWLATHGHSFTRQLLMGSVALAVVRESPVPVVLTRATD